MATESAANDFAHEKGLPVEEIIKRYTLWAQGAKYDQDLREENFRGPNISADTVAQLYPDNKNVSILDVAAGSGFAGEKLKLKGYNNVDALEPSEGMLQLAKDKKIYNRHFLAYLSPDSGVESNHYDVTLICGGMGQGHIPCNAVEDMIRMTKEGGHVVIVMREMYLTTVVDYKDRLEPMFQDWVSKGRWQLTSRTVVPKYSFDNNGVVFIYKVTETSK